MGRSLIPAPWIYIASGAVGVVAGIVLDIAIGWRWWAVALAFPSAVWLGFLATAFTPQARRLRVPGGLSTDLLSAISPKRGMDRYFRMQEKAIRQAPFSLYGLSPSWTGSRWIEGMGWSSGAGPRFTLAHGDPWSLEEAQLSVEVGDERHSRIEWEVGMEDLSSSTPSQEIQIPVDGRAVTFEFVELAPDSEWMAFSSLDDFGLVLRGHHIDPNSVELVTIIDVEPYIRGSREQRERMEHENRL